MARNGSGTYVLPAASQVVTGSTITKAWWDASSGDYATALSGSIAANGETPITGNLPMSAYKHTNVGTGTVRTEYAAVGQIQDGTNIWCGTAGGTANALTLTASPIITAVTAGMTLRFKAGASPNSAATTVTIGSAAAIAVQNNGAACAGGEIAANRWYQITVDAGLTTCQLVQIGYPTYGQIGSGPITCTSISNSGNFAFTGTGNLITGDFSNATFANRPKIQSSTSAGTTVTVIPGSAGSVSTLELWSSTNGSTGSVCYATISDGFYSEIITTHGGAGSYLPFRVRVGGLVSTIHQTSGLFTTNYGIDNTSTTDASSATTGSVKTAGGVGIAKALYVGTTGNFAGAVSGPTATQGTNTTQLASTAFVMGEFNKHKNIAINGGFTVNQRTYVSSAVLASGAHGHDCWKAGSGGGDYSFTQLASNTTITIAANKTLIHVVENKDVQSTAYVLSWTGTALARYAINSATPSGSYAASPILITGQTVGTTMSIEFGNGASTGTLGNVQLEMGNAATAFEYRPYQHDFELCRRRYRRISSNAGNTVYIAASANYSTTQAMCSGETAADMRAMPTIGYSAIGDLGIFTAGSSFTASAISVASIPIESPNITVTTASAWTNGDAGRLYILAGTGKYIEFIADL